MNTPDCAKAIKSISSLLRLKTLVISVGRDEITQCWKRKWKVEWKMRFCRIRVVGGMVFVIGFSSVARDP